MKFGRVRVDQAEGSILAHSLRVMDRKWKKGRVLSRHDVDVLTHEGYETIVAAKLEQDDVNEDATAEAIAQAVAGQGVEIRAAATGRCNLYARHRGLLKLRSNRIDEINSVDEAFTVATLPSYSSVYAGQLLVSIKVIPFAVSRKLLDDCIAVASHGLPPVNVFPYQPLSIGLIQTHTPWFNKNLLEKGSNMLKERANMLGSTIVVERNCDHHENEISRLLGEYFEKQLDVIFLLGASAIQDRNDVIPQGVVNAGGRIEHFGMPVDPGNLLLMAKYGKTTILGLPGCVRSPKRNGFDFVFERIAAGLEVNREDVMNMGRGGILTEPSRRPERRTVGRTQTAAGAKKIAAIVLAAGQSQRMGEQNKLLLKIEDQSVIQEVVNNLEQSEVDQIFVVIGHEEERVRNELKDRQVTFIHNPEYAGGLSTSLRMALSALPADFAGVLVCLGDMPFVRSEQIDALINSFDADLQHNICVPTYHGKRGNPVLWGRRYYQEMMEVRGDVGAKHMIGDYEEHVIEVEVDDAGVVADLDTPESYAMLVSGLSGIVNESGRVPGS